MKTLLVILIFLGSLVKVYGQRELWLFNNLQGTWIEQQDTLNKIIVKDNIWTFLDKVNNEKAFIFKIDKDTVLETGTEKGSSPIIMDIIVFTSDQGIVLLKYQLQEYFKKNRFFLIETDDISKYRSYRQEINNR